MLFRSDFIVGLPNTSQHHDSIWVIVDRLTKTAHFIPVHTEYRAKKYAEIYIDRIVCLHGIPKTIISDRGPQFVARFWEQVQEALGTKLIRSSAYHPQTDGKTERVNQILEDMCRGLFGVPTAGWRNAPAYSLRGSTRGNAKLLGRSSSGARTQEHMDFEWFGPSERNTLHPLCGLLHLV